MAHVGRRWRKMMAVGCSHGNKAHPQHIKDVLEFRKRFQPDIRIHLGDLIDTACFRSGAAGTKDEVERPEDDMSAAERFLQQYEPNWLAFGNHDWRLYELSTHPKAIVAALASQLWTSINSRLQKLKCRTVPYDIEDGWFALGGVAFSHGFMFNQQAVRDHAEMVGGPVVIAHLHHPHQVDGRTLRDSPSFCVGALADDRQLTYGRRRRQSLTHGPGIVYGYISETEARLWLTRSENGKPMMFPPGI